MKFHAFENAHVKPKESKIYSRLHPGFRWDINQRLKTRLKAANSNKIDEQQHVQQHVQKHLQSANRTK